MGFTGNGKARLSLGLVLLSLRNHGDDPRTKTASLRAKTVSLRVKVLSHGAESAGPRAGGMYLRVAGSTLGFVAPTSGLAA